MRSATLLKEAVFVGCGFEMVGIRYERVPTISKLAGRHPLVGIVVFLWLAAHFWKARALYLSTSKEQQ